MALLCLTEGEIKSKLKSRMSPHMNKWYGDFRCLQPVPAALWICSFFDHMMSQIGVLLTSLRFRCLSINNLLPKAGIWEVFLKRPACTVLGLPFDSFPRKKKNGSSRVLLMRLLSLPCRSGETKIDGIHFDKGAPPAKKICDLRIMTKLRNLKSAPTALSVLKDPDKVYNLRSWAHDQDYGILTQRLAQPRKGGRFISLTPNFSSISDSAAVLACMVLTMVVAHYVILAVVLQGLSTHFPIVLTFPHSVFFCLPVDLLHILSHILFL